ncbi:SDR family oxidoreductase [Robiginitalea sp.]|jgi:NAD(P)-dependent dehydrogenase (short-subunit alcohol dehydrogenase family)|uniref:SDR family oxidoreductase n=1 Tax=Robiginitalea sp. TaxID=1902411 RepID=UPI003C76628B
MKGKNCVVTGGNSGIGFETARALAEQGANVLILSRNREKAEAAVETIRAQSSGNHIDFVLADLSSHNSIREASKDILRDFNSIDILVNNAGAWFSKLELTPDGVERQFAINHLAYFLLTKELMGALTNSEDGRVVCVGSDSHFHGKIHFDDVSLRSKYHGLRAYAQSKLANVMFVYELDRRLKQKGIENIAVNCVQPGRVNTDIGLKHTISFHSLAWRIRRIGGLSPAAGAATNIFLATDEKVKGLSGKYWDKCKPKPSSPGSYIQEDAARLWEISESLCGVGDYFEGLTSV